jgi:hypothetical protein
MTRDLARPSMVSIAMVGLAIVMRWKLWKLLRETGGVTPPPLTTLQQSFVQSKDGTLRRTHPMSVSVRG